MSQQALPVAPPPPWPARGQPYPPMVGGPTPPAAFLAGLTNQSDRAAAGYGWQHGYVAAREDGQYDPVHVHRVALRVYGTPAPQGSKRAVVHKASGKAVVMESSKRVKPWREAVKTAALDAITCPCLDDCCTLMAGYPIDGPITARMVFTFARPRGHYRTGRNSHLLRDSAPVWPATIPDLSKLIRSTEDALKDAGLIRDDSRIVEYQRAAKVWVGEDTEALDRPGAYIVITAMQRPALDVGSGDAREPTLPPDPTETTMP